MMIYQEEEHQHQYEMNPLPLQWNQTRAPDDADAPAAAVDSLISGSASAAAVAAIRLNLDFQMPIISQQHDDTDRPKSPKSVATSCLSMQPAPFELARFSEDSPGRMAQQPTRDVHPRYDPLQLQSNIEIDNDPLAFVHVHDDDYNATPAHPFSTIYHQVQEQDLEYQQQSQEQTQPSEDDENEELISPLLQYSQKAPRNKQLFVYYLPSDMIESELLDLFSRFGQVVSASIVIVRCRKGSVVSSSRNHGYITFEEQKDADDAVLRLNSYEVSIYTRSILYSIALEFFV